jgi:cation diffusion facilitator family transporter
VERRRLTRFAWLAIAAAVVTLALKGGAYLLTGSVGLLSDALESFVNVAGATMALAMLSLAARPPDEDHAYGHGKAEYFGGGFEGALILVAAGGIGYAAVLRLLEPRPIEEPLAGLALAAIAAILNLAVGRVLLAVSRRHDSILLEGSARHLLTDVWTSAAVIAGVGAVVLTGWERADPLIGLAVAAYIVRSGFSLVQRSALGLMDSAIPLADREAVRGVLLDFERRGVEFHALRTRRAGHRRFISFHVLVPGSWTVQEGHELAEEVEAALRDAVSNSTIFTHLEPVEDPVSFEDTQLERVR